MKKAVRIWRAISHAAQAPALRVRASFSQERMTYIPANDSSDGEDAGAYDLTINRVGSIYQMFWRSQGELMFEGIGMDTDAGIAISYGPVTGNRAFLLSD